MIQKEGGNRGAGTSRVVRIHIAKLTMEGMSHADGVRVGQVLTSGLTQLTSAGLPARPRRLSRLDAGSLPPGATPDQIGQILASRIFAELKAPDKKAQEQRGPKHA